MSPQLSSYNFVLVLSGVSEPDDLLEDALFEAGCDDATLSFRSGIAYLEFDRNATKFELAILSAIRDVDEAHHEVSIFHVEPSDLVSASEIARRLGWSREYIRLLVQGKRGNGQFPIPHSGVSSTTLIWSWLEVVHWLMSQNKSVDGSLLQAAETTHCINNLLHLRRNPDIEKRRLQMSRQLPRLRGLAGYDS